VEFAMVLPLVVAFLLASVEFGRAVHVNHAIQEASQSACRVYAVRNTTQAQAESIITTAMSEAGIAEGDYQVNYEPATKAAITTHMEPVTVTVTVNYDSVGFIAGNFLNNATITGKAIMPADLEIIDDYDPINPLEEEEEEEEEPEDDDEPVGGGDDDDIPPKPWWWPSWWDWPVPWY
jgi:Flp pilus assembly protein TadG